VCNAWQGRLCCTAWLLVHHRSMPESESRGDCEHMRVLQCSLRLDRPLAAWIAATAFQGPATRPPHPAGTSGACHRGQQTQDLKAQVMHYVDECSCIQLWWHPMTLAQYSPTAAETPCVFFNIALRHKALLHHRCISTGNPAVLSCGSQSNPAVRVCHSTFSSVLAVRDMAC
jgi:hypothetical protein